MISYDELPQKQQLILSVLTARWRLGNTEWTFPPSLRNHLEALAHQGYLTTPTGCYPSPIDPKGRAIRVSLTAAGRLTLHDNGLPTSTPAPVPANAGCAWCTHNPDIHNADGCHYFNATKPGQAMVRCRCSRNREQALNRGLDRATLKPTPPDADPGGVRDLIRDLTDADPCSYDHHGHCQAHSWLQAGECPHARAKTYLRTTTTRL